MRMLRMKRLWSNDCQVPVRSLFAGSVGSDAHAATSTASAIRKMRTGVDLTTVIIISRGDRGAAGLLRRHPRHHDGGYEADCEDRNPERAGTVGVIPGCSRPRR